MPWGRAADSDPRVWAQRRCATSTTASATSATCSASASRTAATVAACPRLRPRRVARVALRPRQLGEGRVEVVLVRVPLAAMAI